MPLIHISRKKEFINRFKYFKLLVNNQDIGELNSRGIASKDLPEGTYSFQAKKGLICSSQVLKLHLNAGEKNYIQISTNKSIKYLMLLYGLFTALLATSKMHNLEYLAMFIALSATLGSLYFFTIGRRKYLILKHSNKPFNS